MIRKKLILNLIVILVILIVIVFGGILICQWLSKEKLEKVKYLTYRNVDVNISFQYPSNLHLIQSYQRLFEVYVCIETPPSPNYAYYDVCQRRTFEPFLSLVSKDGQSIIEISDLRPTLAIDNLEILWEKFLKQYFSEYSFDKKDSILIDKNKLPVGSSARKEPFALIYSSSNPNAPLVAFFPIGRERHPSGWALVLKDKNFKEALNVILKSFNLNNTVQLVKTDLTDGRSILIDSPLFIQDLKFHDFSNQRYLLSDAEKLLIFDEKTKKFTELFKLNEIGEWLKISPEHLWMVYYSGSFVFDRSDTNVIYSLIGLGIERNFIFKYNILTKEKEIVYQGELPILANKIYPPLKENLIIHSSYGDAGCFSETFTILNLIDKTLKKGHSLSWCEEDQDQPLFIEASPDGIYIFVAYKEGNYSKLYLYNNLKRTKALLWKQPKEIRGAMIGTYRFRFYDEEGNPKVYNLQNQKFELFDELTREILQTLYTPIKYNENGFIYERDDQLYYLDYINGKLTQLSGITPKNLLFLTNQQLVSWK